MRFGYSHASVAVVVVAVAMASGAAAQQSAPEPAAATGATLPSASPESLTGKERLGKKWTDEQRIDNCKVPVDKRGAKPRPDTCPDVSSVASRQRVAATAHEPDRQSVCAVPAVIERLSRLGVRGAGRRAYPYAGDG